ncbi:MAG: DUF4440 domain-containing protein [Rhodospirillaceae bacterium]|nr:DUF4440 domain-containing protein [Rhodospirillaceae bacterium]
MGKAVRRVIGAALLAVAMAAGAAAQSGPPAPILEGSKAEIDAILAVLGQWRERRDAGDIDGVMALHHPDVQIMTRGRALIQGRAGARAFYAENYAAGSSRKQYGALSELRVFGDAAVMTGCFLVIDAARGIEDPGYYIIVLRKDASGAWQIYRDIDTPSPDGLALKPAP